ncbi:TetR/AcrR family transcriptional regulator [Streptomyces sp. NPDC101062]|uniref:TetR/AcrR family transcriptional regulator n=1 Tax=unclassified Streptomyces TaxID=2593676 RepID=UPI002E7A6B26|nr:TetR family transcriptional regulator [Streptomyces sp. JV176]MEE1802765.1 TetR family transcriptional regulator [Streptomyces sp. JV176]
MSESEVSAVTGGLRARKKQRTRESLLRVALELFTTQGYERTTVDEIAEAVEVSQRTFFRYFASKEEAAFALVDMVESRFVEALRARPAAEGPFEAMRNAVSSVWGSVGDTIESVVTVELYMRSYRMIESTPVLLAAHLRRSSDLEDGVARLIADRENLDVDADPRPRVAVAAFTGVMRATGRIWGRGEDCSVAGLGRMTEAYLDQLTPRLLRDDWH